ncbi:hypothetical protein [Methanoregula sp.]|uniref:hypothetical protein n=1 Tax=Methanoregula sp. TaxID=2052170 RepID=UPI002604CF86|nr:hypothetical protein [Methanoregula sp.]MDD5142798.1 hypothetical protein [Methanoregula sp.]
MKIEKEIRLVHCSDGRIKKEFLLSAPVTREFAAACRKFGEVKEIDGLKKPFFTFLIPDCLNIKGFIGETSIEAWFLPEYAGAGERFLIQLVEGAQAADERLMEERRRLLALMAGSRK